MQAQAARRCHCARRRYWHTMPHLLCASCWEDCKGVRNHGIAEAPLA